MSEVLPNTSPSPPPPEPAHAGPAAVTHEVVAVVSPGREDEEEKNQDRVLVVDAADGRNAPCRYAVVCDGTSSSPYAADAAEYVSGRVRELFQEEGIGRAAAALKEMRLSLLDRPLKPIEGQSDLLRSMFEEIVRKKHEHAYQTTFVAACLKRDERGHAGSVYVKAIACGDSALFIFSGDGELLYNNVHLSGNLDPFKHGSPLTAVLPDSYGGEAEHALFDFKEYPQNTHLLLCSDGLYDAFTNFQEIYDWLNEHGAELDSTEAREGHLSELHRRLNGKKGDDDISFIWLRPPREEKEEGEPVHEAEVVAGVGDVEGVGQVFFARALARLFRWCRLTTRRFFQRGRRLTARKP
jgi:serine/threonine protein phosphatase PrpC